MSTAEDFILRERTFLDTVDINRAQLLDIRVSRTRTSKGHAAIFLKIGAEKRIEISREKYGESYLDIATAIVNTLKQALDDPCSLPKM